MNAGTAAWIACNLISLAATGYVVRLYRVKLAAAQAALERALGKPPSLYAYRRIGVRRAETTIRENVCIAALGGALIVAALLTPPPPFYVVAGTAWFAAIWVRRAIKEDGDYDELLRATDLAEEEERRWTGTSGC